MASPKGKRRWLGGYGLRRSNTHTERRRRSYKFARPGTSRVRRFVAGKRKKGRDTFLPAGLSTTPHAALPQAEKCLARNIKFDLQFARRRWNIIAWIISLSSVMFTYYILFLDDGDGCAVDAFHQKSNRMPAAH